MNEALIKLYSQYPYPEPFTDLPERQAKGLHEAGDPSHYAALLWPSGPPAKLRILVAGCGSTQAASIAFANPSSEVLGVDLSAASLAHEQKLIDMHRISNLTLRQADLTQEALGSFDLIICTGVLHHLVSPGDGLIALRKNLSPSGVMVLMLYGTANRVGLYMVQDMLRRMGAKQDAHGIEMARNLIDALPANHYVRRIIGNLSGRDVGSDAGVVDAFLHPQDRAYSCSEVLEFVQGAGLEFQGWLDNSFYYPHATIPPGPIHEAVSALPDREQWSIVENFTLAIGRHMFIATNQPRSAFEVSFDGDAWLSYRPTRAPGLVRPSGTKIQRGAIGWDPGAFGAYLADQANGQRTIRETIFDTQVHGSDADRIANARRLYEACWKTGLLYYPREQAHYPVTAQA